MEIKELFNSLEVVFNDIDSDVFEVVPKLDKIQKDCLEDPSFLYSEEVAELVMSLLDNCCCWNISQHDVDVINDYLVQISDAKIPITI